jgi:phage terminase Nu1 subunit (DNA packaging protein)
MKKVIETLAAAVEKNATVDTVQTLYPQLGNKAADIVLTDVIDYLNKDINLDQLAMFLMNQGIQETEKQVA